MSELLGEYDDRHFIKADGTLNFTTNVTYTHEYMRLKGARLDGRRESVEGLVELYPDDYFCAKEAGSGKLRVTENTYTIHHFAASWHTPRERMIAWIGGRFGKRAAMAVGLLTRNPLTVPMRVCKYIREGT